MCSQFCRKTFLIVGKITKKNIISKIWTSRGYISAVTQFVRQFTHVSLEILEFKVENQNKC